MADYLYDDYTRRLRQYGGTELSPPGAGTYYRPQRYAGFGGNIQRVQRNLARAWQSDLAYNVAANPRVAQALEAERIGAQYGGRPMEGRPGFITYNLPASVPSTVTRTTRTFTLPETIDPKKLALRAKFFGGLQSTTPTASTASVAPVSPVSTGLPANPFIRQLNLSLATGNNAGLQFSAPTPPAVASPSRVPSPPDMRPIAYLPPSTPTPSPTPYPYPRPYFATSYSY